MALFPYMSLRGGLLIISILLLRLAAYSYFPKRFFVHLWIIASLSMILPVSFPAAGVYSVPLSIAGDILSAGRTGSNPAVHTDTEGRIAPLSEAAEEAMPDKGKNSSYGQPVLKGSTERSAASASGMPGILRVLLYGAGAALSALILFLPGKKENEILREALPITDPQREQLFLYVKKIKQKWLAYSCYGFCADGKTAVPMFVSDRIKTPVSFGLLRPRIILAKTMSGQEYRQLMYVLIHEMIHVKRRDNLIRIICAAACIVHWFNPLSWVMFRMLKMDIELSCDEKVLDLTGMENRAAYAQSLVLAASDSPYDPVLYSAFGKNACRLKRRIKEVMNMKKKKKGALITGAFLLVTAVSAFGSPTVRKAGDADAQKTESIGGSPETETQVSVPIADNPHSRIPSLKEKVVLNQDGEEIFRTLFSFDSSGNCTQALLKQPSGNTLTKYVYDQNQKLSGAEYYDPDGTLSGKAVFTLDQNGYVTKRTEYRGKTVSDTGGTETYSYDSAGNVVTDSMYDSGSNLKDTFINEYSLDPSGASVSGCTVYRITGDSREVFETVRYEYGEENRLLAENRYDEQGNPETRVEYHYNGGSK